MWAGSFLFVFISFIYSCPYTHWRDRDEEHDKKPTNWLTDMKLQLFACQQAQIVCLHVSSEDDQILLIDEMPTLSYLISVYLIVLKRGTNIRRHKKKTICEENLRVSLRPIPNPVQLLDSSPRFSSHPIQIDSIRSDPNWTDPIQFNSIQFNPVQLSSAQLNHPQPSNFYLVE